MKKIEKILLAFVFMVVGLFGMGSVNAAELSVKYNVSSYEYFFDGSSQKLNGSLVTEKNDVINTAISKFYTAASGAEKVNVVPFKFNVKSGSTWESTDKITMYINIPNELNLDDSTHIYLMKIDAATGAYKVYSVDGQFNGLTYSIKSESEISDFLQNQMRIDTVNGKNIRENLSNKFAVLETSDFSTTGDTYYALITCKGKEITTTTTTTTTVPNQTTTTTIENPKTFDANNQLYIVIGVIGLVGIIGLGVKFASSSK